MAGPGGIAGRSNSGTKGWTMSSAFEGWRPPHPMQPSVVVVGSFVKDLAFRCGLFPRAGETVIGTFTTGPGGKGSNQAVAAARAGARTRFIGAVGRDAFGAEAARFLGSEGIDARLAAKKGLATGAAAILVDRGSQNEIIVALGASAAI